MANISDMELNVIKNEIRMAERINEEKLLPVMREALERYTSKHVPFKLQDPDIVLNEIYPIIQNELPAIFFRNPKVFLKPRNKNFVAKRFNPITGRKEEVFLDSAKSARTQEHLLNYTMSQIRYKQEVRKTLLDSLLFPHGILWHGYKGEFGMTDEQSIFIESEQLFVKRISPMMFLFDPTVSLSNIDEARWIARSFHMSMRDLKDDPDLKVDPRLKGEQGFGMRLQGRDFMNGGQDTKIIRGRGSKTLLDLTDDEFQRGDGSRFVKVYEVLRRPSKKEKLQKKKGHILLLAQDQKKPLRVDDWPYKAEGWPGKVLMFNDVPDSIFGMSDMEVFGQIADHKNLVINLQLRNAQENSRNIIIFDKTGMDEEEVQKIENGDQDIIGVNGPVRDKIASVTPGGAASSELYILDTRIQQNLDNASGIPDIKRGVVRTGEESAKSVQSRILGAGARPAYRQDIMVDFLKDSTLYLNQLNKQFMPIKEAVRIIGSLDIEWSENPTKEEIQADVDAEMDVVSMLPESPEKEIQELTTILNLMVEAINNPALSQKIMTENKTFSISPIIENLLLRLKIRDPEVFRSIRPEESQGFVSVSELREAQANTEAALQGQPPPFPPAEGQDHRARLSLYDAVQRIFQLEGRVSDILQQLILTQQALAEQEVQAKAPRTGQSLKKPAIQTPSFNGVGG